MRFVATPYDSKRGIDREAEWRLANDAMLPAQWFERRRFTREQKLWLAVVQEAIDCATRQGCKGARAERRDSARQWIASNSTKPASFVWICEVLELEPETLRKGVLGLAKYVKRPRARVLSINNQI